MSNFKRYEFDLNQIKCFGFSEQQYTKHPMDNPIVDFTGLGTQEKELQYIIDEGNILIETDSKNIKFGKHVPSWEVEVLLEKIESFTGRKFTKPILNTPSENTSIKSEEEEDIELEEKTSGSSSNTLTYECNDGLLQIEQKKTFPSVDDTVFLNGKLAPSGKYQIGNKQFVFVSNGKIYATRGFAAD